MEDIDRRRSERVGDNHTGSTDTQTELPPATLTTASMFRGGPFTFAHDRESCAVDDEMDRVLDRNEMQPYIEVLTTPRDGGVVGSFEIDIHQRQ